MKKVLTFLLIVFACITVSAERITEQQALQKAQQFMNGKQLAIPNRARGRGFQTKDTISHGYYVFNAVESNGFVIIASDDRMPEVLGYSDRGSLDPKTAPCNVKWLLEYYDKVAANIRDVGAKARAIKKISKPDVRPLITTTWDQGAPYNDQCPENNGSRCITGCVATAMAQVINYNRWPIGETKSVPAYTTGSAQISVPELEPTSFDWDNMTNDDVARLMRYCGQSVKMDYGVNESGAMPSDEAPALINIFRYSQTTHYAEHEYYSDEEWEDLLYNELAEQRPIVYNGWGIGGGHTFVVHGYREGRFYINWGWSGNEDGYFLLTGLNTGIGDFNDTQTATIGIQPPAGSDVSRPRVVVKRISYNGGEKYTFRDESGQFSFNVSGTLASDLAEQKSLVVGLGLYDANGLNKVLWEEQHDFPIGEDYMFDTRLIIGNDIADGEYRIVPISRDDVNDTWRTDANSSDYYLTITISGNYMKVLSYPLSPEERNINDFGVETVDGITYNFYKQKDKYRAMVLPCETGSYQGDVYIPDLVNHQGTDFKVYKSSFGAFLDCHDLTSLSLGMTNLPIIWNCERLKKLELREGVIQVGQIGGCAQLESIEYPKSLILIEHAISMCQSLKTIRFNNNLRFIFEYCPEWDNNSLPSLTDVYFTAVDAPLIRGGNYPPHSTAIIHVPQGSKAEYEVGGWSGWNIIEDLPVPDTEGIEWGYCEGNTVADGGPYDMVGGNDGEYAIHVPAAMIEAYKGKTISSIQVYQSMAYDYVFITKPGTDYLVKQPVEGVVNSWINVPLPEPYTITGDELFVGVGHKGSVGMLFADENAIEKDGLWFRVMGADDSQYEPGEWICIPELDQSFAHPIPVRFIIAGDDMPADAVLRDVSITSVSKSKYYVSAKVVNRMTNQLRTMTVNWNFDGENSGSKTFELDVRPGHSDTFSFDVDVTLINRNNNFNYSISQINDVTDMVAANSTGTINFNTEANTFYPRRIVMEEATGTWCGWCVRGIETIDRLKALYPDNFIAIGLHNSDEMANHINYGVIANKFNSYPSCIIDRIIFNDPALPKIQPLIEEMKDKAPAKVSATAVYAKRDYSAITVNTESVFGFSDDKSVNFRLAYALVEDHVGPYVQANYYSGMTLDSDQEFMEEWTKKDARVSLEFNDVARGLFGGPDGVEGSVPNIIKEGEAYKFAYTFSLPDNISKRENLRLVVMLIDNISGEIVNACQTTIEYDPSVENQVFLLTNNGESILDGETVTFASEISESGIVGDCGTNVEAGKAGLVIKAYDSNSFDGTAKLEILSNGIAPQTFTWSMGGTSESIVGKDVVEKTFKTNANGEVKVGLTAGKMQSYGKLEARLTVTIGDQTETVNIVFLNEKPVVGNITVSNDQVWWCNYDTRDADEGGLGTGLAEHMMAAIHVPFNLLGGEGTTIDAFSFRSSGACMANAAVWISRKLPDSEDMADLEVIKIPAKQLKEFDWHEIAFTKSYEIPENGLYVGYSFDIIDVNAPGGSYPIMYTTSDTNRKGGLWVKADSNPKWTDMGLKFGNLFAKVLFGGDTFTRNSVTTTDFAPVSVMKGGKAKVRMRLVNEGADKVEQLTIEVKSGDGSSTTTTVNALIEPYSEKIIDFELKADDSSSADTKIITVSKINGHDNTTTGSMSGKVRLFTVENKPSYTPVFETISGTWMWGGIRQPFESKELTKTFGDKIILIYPHIDDVMEIIDYSDITDTLKIMRMYVNRGEAVDSYYGTNWEQWGIKDYIRQELNSVAPGSINVSAEWADEDKKHLDIHTESVFEMSFDDNPFLIGYVLLEDGLHGTGNQWVQYNQYAGEDIDDPFFQEMAALPSKVSDMYFDNIPVAAWGVYKGVEGTLPENIVANDKNAYSYSVDISDNFLIQNKENLSVVALLLDKNTGKIHNAARFRLGEGIPAPEPDPDPQEGKVFEFRFENKSLENNEVVEIYAEEDSFGFDELNCETNPSANPKNGLILATLDGKKQSGSATISITKNTLNPQMVQWCMGGECVPMNNKTSLTKDFTTDEEGVCLVMFDALNIKSDGMLEAKLTATIGSETHIVNIKFVCDNANGISIIYSDDENAVWHDMNGSRLANAPNRKGVYIKNGKKVVK